MRGMNSFRRHHFLFSSIGLFSSPYLLAQAFPNKPIKMIVPVPPGGGADAVARAYAQQLSKIFRQTNHN
jgi:tripartite-type tricarboxylate transporter receptor subunit TctC